MAKVHTISMSAKAFAELVAWLGLISVAISPEYLISQTTVASDLVSNISSIHKLVVVLALLPYALFFGLREKANPIIVAYLVVLLMTFTLASWPPDLQASQAFRAFTSFVLGWFVFSLNWQQRLAHKYLLTISLMPIISVAGGVVLSSFGIYSFYAIEYTGALRLQGLNIASILAMLAFIGLGCAFTLTVKNNWYLLLGLANFAILVFTGSRSGILASIFVLMGYLFVQVRSVRRGRAISSINLLALLGTIVLVFFAYLPNLEARMSGNSSGQEDIKQGDTAGETEDIKQGDTAGETEDVDTSGRSVAWDFLLEEALENPWFGRGLGAGTIVGGQVTSEGEIVNPAFRAPHNEYLRMFVDGGVVGTLLLLLGFGIVFRRILQSVRAESKLYLAAFLVGFAVYSLTDNTLSTIQFFIPFCWYLGVLYTQHAQALTKCPRGTSQEPPP